MTLYRRLHLEASDPGRNCHRQWVLEARPDLFGACLVEITYGRIGAMGRTISRAFSDEKQARRYISQAIARRKSAPRRIGIAYRIVVDDHLNVEGA